MRSAFDAVEPVIADHHRIGWWALGRASAAFRTVLAAHLEHIGKICGETKGQRDRVWLEIEIADVDQLVVRVFPDELSPVYIDQLPAQCTAIALANIGIGEVNGQERVV